MSAIHPIQPESSQRAAESHLISDTGTDNLTHWREFLFYAVLLCAAHAIPLWRLFRHAWVDEIQSYILLIPVVSGYLVVVSRHQWMVLRRARPKFALIPGLLGGMAAGIWCLVWLSGVLIGENVLLSLVTFSFLAMLAAGGFWFLGALVMRQLAFPAAFLVFMIPVPPVAMEGINIFLQHASAEAANMMLMIGGPPFVRDGLHFQLPGITLFVAEECSGVRSTLVLFITSTLASYLFLRSGWRRTLLVAVVLPIAILRNGFRIYVIAMLCVHIDPSMIHSIIHKRGGPLFFALSLIPLFGLLVWLRRKEQNGAKADLGMAPGFDQSTGVK